MASRLPIYVLLDCSESMAGPAIEAVNAGVRALLAALRSDPVVVEMAALSFITFDAQARQVVPLSDVLAIRPPILSVLPGTALGAALRLLARCLRTEVVRTTAGTKGDYRPLVFLITDGQPTDDWEAGLAQLRSDGLPRIANIYAIACGQDVDLGVLHEITDIVLETRDLTADAIRRCFVLLSASIQSASAAVDAGAAPSLPTLDGIALAPRLARSIDPARQIFIRALCGRGGQPYLMRYARKRGQDYEAIAAHPVGWWDAGAAGELPPVDVRRLDGTPPCPHCANQGAAVCPCGAVFCVDPLSRRDYRCPACELELVPSGEPADLALRQSAG
ncbi:MAG: VWA domain-containing protein [Candidatus Sericytochromatia bacterium]|nr:VWA domain-containing protein [Candidatus Tanganyikabacteria bacterium]